MPVIARDLRYAHARPLFVRGWSPTHQQPISTGRIAQAKRWPDRAAFVAWLSEQPGAANYVGEGGRERLFELMPTGEDS